MNNKLFYSISLVTVLVYLITRFYQIGNDFVGYDAYYFKDQSYIFMMELEHGNFKEIPRTIQPGVLTMYLNIIGFKVLYFLSDKIGYIYSNNLDLALHFYQKFFKALFVSSCLFTSVYLMKKIYNKYVALLFFMLFTIEPIFIIHTRAIQTDIIQSVGLLTSLLAFMYFYETNNLKYGLLTGVFMALAFTEKSPSIIVIIGLVIFAYFFENRSIRKIKITRIIIPVITMFLSVVIIYPLMWVKPFDTLKTMTIDAYLFGAKGINTETGSLEKYVDSSIFSMYYAKTLFFKHSIFTLASFLLATAITLIKKSLDKKTLTIVTFAIFYLIVLQVSDKKFDRYFIIFTIFMITFIAVTLEKYFSKKTYLVYILIGLVAGTITFLTWKPQNIVGYNNAIFGLINREKYVSEEWGAGFKTLGSYLEDNYDDYTVYCSNMYSLKPFFPGEIKPIDEFNSSKTKSVVVVQGKNNSFAKTHNLKHQKDIIFKNTLLFSVFTTN